MKFTQEFGKLRKAHGLSHVALQQKFAEYDMTVTLQRISKWENGHAFPSLAEFFVLCEILHIHNPAEYFSDYREPQLNDVGLRKVQEYREDLIATGLYRPQSQSVRRLPLYLLPASAGTGQFLDSSDFEMVDVDDSVPESADFGIPIAGDSMEPRFHDGDHVWVQKASTLDSGEIGVFYLDGDAYIKKLRNDENGVALISLNPSYPPIEISSNSDFRIFGKVIS